jgi:hypothetical protein
VGKRLRLALPPAVKNSLDFGGNGRPGLVALPPTTKKLVVSSVNVADMGPNGKLDRLRLKPFGRGGTTNPAGVLQARLLRNGESLGLRTTRKELTDPLSEAGNVLRINPGLPLRIALPRAPPGFCVG